MNKKVIFKASKRISGIAWRRDIMNKSTRVGFKADDFDDKDHVTDVRLSNTRVKFFTRRLSKDDKVTKREHNRSVQVSNRDQYSSARVSTSVSKKSTHKQSISK